MSLIPREHVVDLSEYRDKDGILRTPCTVGMDLNMAKCGRFAMVVELGGTEYCFCACSYVWARKSVKNGVITVKE